MTWDESKHPRKENGEFTYKNGGNSGNNSENGTFLKGRIEKTENNSAISNVSDKLSAGEIASIAINVLGKLATPALILYSDIDSLIKTIKENKLEDKFNIALQNTINKKEKNIKNKNSNKEYKVNSIKYSSKIKEDSMNFLGSDKRNNNTELNFQQNKKYKDILLDILKDKATPADILYGTKEKLEKKIKEYGLEDRLKGIMTGTVSNINKQEISNKTGDYGFNHPALSIFHYRKLSKEYDKEVGEFLQKNTDNPKDYSNDIRHQFVSAIFARNLGEDVTKRFGDINELMPADLLDPADSKIDKINNEIGRNYAKQYPNMPREQLLELMLKEYLKNKQLIIKK